MGIAIRNILKGAVAFAVIGIVAAKVAVKRSPVPFVEWLRRQPDPGPVPPANLADYEKDVEVQKDLVYPSRYGSNTLDLYVPKAGRDKLPTLLWIHGGGFVAGDKSGTSDWCTMMASQGYAVISMNYELAPEARYPVPVVQMGEVCRHLEVLSGRWPRIDPGRLIVGGDSAGAQIASQFLAIQTNPELARLTGISPTVPATALKAALLFCGPYQIDHLAGVSSKFAKWFMNQLGWAYIGVRDWSLSEQARHASTASHITPDFPPTFLTDGNTGSFESHGKELEAMLRRQGVSVGSLFFPSEHGAVGHEYQFKLNTTEALTCFEATISFLDRRLRVESYDEAESAATM